MSHRNIRWKQVNLKNMFLGTFSILDLYRKRVHCSNKVQWYFLTFLESRQTEYCWTSMKLRMRLLDLLGSGAHHRIISFSREMDHLADKLKLYGWWMGSDVCDTYFQVYFHKYYTTIYFHLNIMKCPFHLTSLALQDIYL